MIIKKYIAKTEKDAIEKAKEELGSNAIVMNVKKVHPRGVMRIFLRAKVEVTAALDENTTYSEEKPAKEVTPTVRPRENGHGNQFDVSIPPLEGLPPLEKSSGKPQGKTTPISSTPASEKQTNEERLTQLFTLLEKQMEEKSVSSAPSAEPARQATRVEAPKPVKEEKPPAEKPKPEKAPEKPQTDSEAEKQTGNKDDKSQMYRDLVYKQLVQNEVDPAIADRILDEAKRSLPKDAAVDQILGSVYQRIILMIGQAYTINFKPHEPTKFVFFLGSTGVGKTTTIAKIASKLKLEQNCKLALVTADTYRVAAVEQLRVYADILDVPLHVVYNPDELKEMLDDLQQYDVVLVDTAGCSHKNHDQIKDVKVLLEQVPIAKRLVYLCLSVGTKYKDLLDIAKVYSDITDYSIVFTKLDETSSAGVMLNMKMSTKCPLSYVTNGQNVPDDIERINAQVVAKQVLS